MNKAHFSPLKFSAASIFGLHNIMVDSSKKHKSNTNVFTVTMLLL